MGNKGFVVVIGVLALLLVVKESFFVLNPGQQAVILQFGKPVGKPITDAGLHMKKPFVNKVRNLPKKILWWDGDRPPQVPTKDKKFITIDTTARWKIVDAIQFITRLQDVGPAKVRISSIINSASRNVISRHNLVEAVRNSNMIQEQIKAIQTRNQNMDDKDSDMIDEEITGQIEDISVGREKLSELIKEDAEKTLIRFGIQLIDVQLKRISYAPSIEKKVFERMISERKRIAEKIRSIGQAKKAVIEGRLARDLQKIQSEAYREAQEVRGKAEAKAYAIYAKSLNKGQDFYEFSRTLEAYEKSLSNRANFILSSDSEFLKFLKKGN
jgi:membrane protease subunit HflC